VHEIFELKAVISILFVVTGAGALLTMLYNMGRQEKKVGPETLRKLHIAFGLSFAVLLLVLASVGAVIVSRLGDGMSLRAVLHMVLALELVAIVLLKIVIARFYRGLLRFAPVLGLIVFGLAFVVFFISTGFHVARDLGPKSAATGDGGNVHPGGDPPGDPPRDPPRDPLGDPPGEAVAVGTITASVDLAEVTDAAWDGDAKAGHAIFVLECVSCHEPDSRKSLFGPGLVGLTRREALPASGLLPTAENIWRQLVNPVGNMPSFVTFSDQEITDLLAYLRTL
jgi:mono/diheme cytochrome c family protein